MGEVEDGACTYDETNNKKRKQPGSPNWEWVSCGVLIKSNILQQLFRTNYNLSQQYDSILETYILQIKKDKSQGITYTMMSFFGQVQGQQKSRVT